MSPPPRWMEHLSGPHRWLAILLILMSRPLSHLCTTAESLRGAHLRILPKELKGWMETTRDSSKNILTIRGFYPDVWQWLSQRFNFTYSYMNEIAAYPQDTIFGRGSLSFVVAGDADVALVALTPEWAKLVELTASTSTFDPIRFLIPMPEVQTANVGSIFQPFNYKVWIWILISLPTMIAVIYGVRRVQSVVSQEVSWKWIHAIDYAVGILLYQQGKALLSRKNAVRMAAGAWCLGCFVIGSAYSSVLISYILAPRIEPVINSMEELATKPNVYLTVDRGSFMDVTYTGAEDGILKQLGDKLRLDSRFRCNKTADCLDQVLRSPNHVYTNFQGGLMVLMSEDRKKNNGKCHFTFAKQSSPPPVVCFVLAKHSPNAEYIKRGLMEMWDYGLLNALREKYIPKPWQCLNYQKFLPQHPRLSLANLSGAFALLLTGYGLAILSLLVENFYHIYKRCVRSPIEV